MKKFLSLTIALALLCGTVSCSGGTSEGGISSSAEPVSLTLNAADIQLAGDFSDIINIYRDPISGNIMTFGMLENGGYAGYVSDNSFGDYEQFRFTPQDGEKVRYAVLMRAGRKAVLTVLDGETLIYVYDRDNNQEKTLNCGEVLPEDRYANFIPCDGGFIINEDNSVLTVISSDGESSGIINLAGWLVCGVSADSEGIPTVVYGEGDKYRTAQIEGTSLVNEQTCGSFNGTAFSICAGFGDYSLAAIIESRLWGLKNGEWLELCDFLDNDFSAIELYSIAMTGENEFAAVRSSMDGAKMLLLTEADVSELKSKTVIRIANLVGGDLIYQPAKTYNSAKPDGEFRAEIKDYSAGNDLYDDRITALNRDIISGEAPDVITFNSSISPNTYGARESLFVDLYTLLDEDDDISRGDFLDGYLEGLENNGKLLQISPGFSLNTLVAKDKFLGGLTSWNIDQFMDICSSLPEETEINDSVSDGLMKMVFLNFIDYNTYVDYANAECSFDSAGFIKAMNMVRDNHLGMTIAEYDSWLNSFDEPMYDDGSERQTKYMNDKCMLYNFGLGGFGSLRETMHACFNEPATLIGYPTENGNGTYVVPHDCLGIMANSQSADGAWDYIKTVYFSEGYYNSNSEPSIRGMFPALEKYYIQRLEEQKIDEYTDSETGEIYHPIYWLGGDFDNMMTYNAFSDEECEKYDAIIREAAKDVRQGDSTIYDILYEELDPFFEGERTAEAAADIIQNRVSLYMSERYS